MTKRPELTCATGYNTITLRVSCTTRERKLIQLHTHQRLISKRFALQCKILKARGGLESVPRFTSQFASYCCGQTSDDLANDSSPLVVKEEELVVISFKVLVYLQKTTIGKKI